MQTAFCRVVNKKIRASSFNESVRGGGLVKASETLGQHVSIYIETDTLLRDRHKREREHFTKHQFV